MNPSVSHKSTSHISLVDPPAPLRPQVTLFGNTRFRTCVTLRVISICSPSPTLTMSRLSGTRSSAFLPGWADLLQCLGNRSISCLFIGPNFLDLTRSHNFKRPVLTLWGNFIYSKPLVLREENFSRGRAKRRKPFHLTKIRICPIISYYRACTLVYWNRPLENPVRLEGHTHIAILGLIQKFWQMHLSFELFFFHSSWNRRPLKIFSPIWVPSEL